MSSPLLDIRDLRTGFQTESGLLTAVDGVSLSVEKGCCRNPPVASSAGRFSSMASI